MEQQIGQVRVTHEIKDKQCLQNAWVMTAVTNDLMIHVWPKKKKKIDLMIHARTTERSIAEYVNIIEHVGEPWRGYPYIIHIWAGLNFHEGPSIYVYNK